MKRSKKDNLIVHAATAEGLLFTRDYNRMYDGGNYCVFGCYPEGTSGVVQNGSYSGERLWQFQFTGTHGYDATSASGSDAASAYFIDKNKGLHLYIDTLRNRFRPDVVKVSAAPFYNEYYLSNVPFKGYDENLNPLHHDTVSAIDNCILGKYFYRPYDSVNMDTFEIRVDATVQYVVSSDSSTYTVDSDMICSIYNAHDGYKIQLETPDGNDALYTINGSTTAYSLDVSDDDIENILRTGVMDVSLTSGFRYYEKTTESDSTTYDLANGGISFKTNQNGDYIYTGHFGVALPPECGPFNAEEENGFAKPDFNTISNYPYVYINCLDSSYAISAYAVEFVDPSSMPPVLPPTWNQDGIARVSFINDSIYSYRFAWNVVPRGIRENVSFIGMKALSVTDDDDYVREQDRSIKYFEKESATATTYDDYIAGRTMVDNSEWPMLSTYYRIYPTGDEDKRTLVFFRDVINLDMSSAPALARSMSLVRSADLYYYSVLDNPVFDANGYKTESYSFLPDHESMCNRETERENDTLCGSINISDDLLNLHKIENINISEVTDSDFVDSDLKLALRLRLSYNNILYEPIVGSYTIGSNSTNGYRSCSAAYYDRNNEEYKRLFQISSDTIDIRKVFVEEETGSHDCVLKEIVFEYDSDPKGEVFEFLLDLRTMIGETNDDIERFFSANQIKDYRGSYSYLGKNGLYEKIVPLEKYNNLNDFYPSGGVPYQLLEGEDIYYVADCASLEYGILGLLSKDTPVEDATPIAENIKLMWYLVLDKSDGNVSDDVKIDYIDAKGIKQINGFAEAFDIPIIDATERLKQSSGVYKSIESSIGEIQTEDTLGINSYYGLISRNYDRAHLAFRLITTNGAALLSKNGYTVHVCCRMMNGQGKFNDFVVKTVKLNPACSLTYGDIDNHSTKEATKLFFSSGRKETNKTQFGKIYTYADENSDHSSVFDMSVASAFTQKIYDEKGEYKAKVAQETISEVEKYEYVVDAESPFVNTDLEPVDYDNPKQDKFYHIVGKWEVENINGNQCKINVLHETGCYVRCYDNSFDFKYQDLQAYDAITYTEASGYNKAYRCDDQEIDTHKVVMASGADSTGLKIFDIEDGEGSGKYIVRFETSDMQNIKVQSGTKTADKKPIYVNGDPVDVVVDGSRILTRAVGTEEITQEKYIHLFLSVDDQGTGFENVPDTYDVFTAYDSANMVLHYSEKYYENTGGLDLVFDEFIPIKVNTDVTFGPGEEENDVTGDFHLANKFMYLWVKGEARSENEENMPIKTYKFLFNADLKRGDKNIWHADYGYVNSENGARNTIKLTVGENDNEIGRLKQNVINGDDCYNLKMEYYLTYTYEIYIENKKCKTVTFDGKPKPGDIVEYKEFKPIKTVPPIVITLRKTTVGYGETIVFVNNTENLKYVYKAPNIIMSNGTPFIWENMDSNTLSKEQMFDVGEYTFKVSAELIDGLLNNIEKITKVESVEAPKLYVLERSSYDGSVTRVLDGYDLVYPRRREDVLFSPNEWITAENINRRFEYIIENLNYLVSQTKIYLKPPSKFCGFYGDFQSVINGEYRRAFGYIPVGDLEIYRLYNEHTSIDDANTTIKNCNAMCIDTEPNLYCHQNGKISIYNTSKYESYRGMIVPSLVNEYITYVDRVEFSHSTGKIYALSTNTHKLYIFNSYSEDLRNSNINCTYFGEIGGYGGPYVHGKFNSPNDLFVSTHKEEDGSSTEEIWICDGGNKVIKHFSVKGQWISTIDLTDMEYNLIGACCDYDHNVHVLTDKYVITFTYDGEVKNGFVLKGGLAKPIMIRPQYEAGFLYILYEHWIDKYNLEGKYIGRFAEADDLSYTTMCVTDNYDIYIATNKNILHYNDSLRIRTIAAMDNAKKNEWSFDEIKINRDENIQDAVLNTSFQRMYDNIAMYALCVFGNIVKLDSLDEDRRIADLDYMTYQKIYDFIHKERIFVGINELVTIETINRSLGQMYDLLQLMLDTI